MTMKELRELTDQDFDFFSLGTDGTIYFAGPLPGKYGNGLHHVLLENGRICSTDGDIEQWENAWNAYIADLIRKKEKAGWTRHNRTRKQAEKMGAITNMPTWIALPTLKAYQNALSTIKENSLAYLQPITQELASNLNFENGKLYFFGSDASNVDFAQYYDNRPKTVEKLDLSTLRALYSVILQEVEDTAKDANKIISQVNDQQYLSYRVKIYLPEFLKMLGYKQNLSNDGIESIVDKIRAYSRIIGVIKKSHDVRKSKNEDYYPVMQLVEHDEEENTVQIFSPYINKLIMTILQASIQMDKEGNPKLKGNGQPFLMPSHSHMVKASISKERSKGAVEIVCVAVVLIEQAGNRTPHIKVKTIVDRCLRLKNSFDSAATSSDKGKVLKRAFKRAWELLPQQTRLAEVYKNIQFPTYIPTARDLDMVFEFSHKGKNESV